MLDVATILHTLRRCSYYLNDNSSDLRDALVVTAIQKFQQDHHLSVDGRYGPHTDASLSRYAHLLDRIPPEFQEFRRFRVTHYWIAEQSKDDVGHIPIYGLDRKIIALVSPRFFVELALEGNGRLADGRLVNVTGSWIPAELAEYEPVYAIAESNGWVPDKLGYAGLRHSSNMEVNQVMSFFVMKSSGIGYGVANGMPLTPLRSCASDIGAYGLSEPLYKAHGGLLPVGSRIYCLDLVDTPLPDSTQTHDGWVNAHDTGGAIYGAHVDLFMGCRRSAGPEGILLINAITPNGELLSSRIPAAYSYGL